MAATQRSNDLARPPLRPPPCGKGFGARAAIVGLRALKSLSPRGPLLPWAGKSPRDVPAVHDGEVHQDRKSSHGWGRSGARSCSPSQELPELTSRHPVKPPSGSSWRRPSPRKGSLTPLSSNLQLDDAVNQASSMQLPSVQQEQAPPQSREMPKTMLLPPPGAFIRPSSADGISGTGTPRATSPHRRKSLSARELGGSVGLAERGSAAKSGARSSRVMGSENRESEIGTDILSSWLPQAPPAEVQRRAVQNGEKAQLQEHEQKLLDAVFDFPMAEEAAAFMLGANPELSWLAQCVQRCPLPPCWSALESRSGIESTRFVDMGTGAVTDSPPLLHEFVELTRVMLFWRSNPSQACLVSERLAKKHRSFVTEAEETRRVWTGPHVDPGTGMEYWHCPVSCRSTWGDPGAAADFLARVIDKLRQALPDVSVRGQPLCYDDNGSRRVSQDGEAFRDVGRGLSSSRRKRSDQKLRSASTLSTEDELSDPSEAAPSNRELHLHAGSQRRRPLSCERLEPLSRPPTPQASSSSDPMVLNKTAGSLSNALSSAVEQPTKSSMALASSLDTFVSKGEEDSVKMCEGDLEKSSATPLGKSQGVADLAVTASVEGQEIDSAQKPGRHARARAADSVVQKLDDIFAETACSTTEAGVDMRSEIAAAAAFDNRDATEEHQGSQKMVSPVAPKAPRLMAALGRKLLPANDNDEVRVTEAEAAKASIASQLETHPVVLEQNAEAIQDDVAHQAQYDVPLSSRCLLPEGPDDFQQGTVPQKDMPVLNISSSAAIPTVPDDAAEPEGMDLSSEHHEAQSEAAAQDLEVSREVSAVALPTATDDAAEPEGMDFSSEHHEAAQSEGVAQDLEVSRDVRAVAEDVFLNEQDDVHSDSTMPVACQTSSLPCAEAVVDQAEADVLEVDTQAHTATALPDTEALMQAGREAEHDYEDIRVGSPVSSAATPEAVHGEAVLHEIGCMPAASSLTSLLLSEKNREGLVDDAPDDPTPVVPEAQSDITEALACHEDVSIQCGVALEERATPIANMAFSLADSEASVEKSVEQNNCITIAEEQDQMMNSHRSVVPSSLDALEVSAVVQQLEATPTAAFTDSHHILATSAEQQNCMSIAEEQDQTLNLHRSVLPSSLDAIEVSTLVQQTEATPIAGLAGSHHILATSAEKSNQDSHHSSNSSKFVSPSSMEALDENGGAPEPGVTPTTCLVLSSPHYEVDANKSIQRVDESSNASKFISPSSEGAVDEHAAVVEAEISPVARLATSLPSSDTSLQTGMHEEEPALSPVGQAASPLDLDASDQKVMQAPDSTPVASKFVSPTSTGTLEDKACAVQDMEAANTANASASFASMETLDGHAVAQEDAVLSQGSCCPSLGATGELDIVQEAELALAESLLQEVDIVQEAELATGELDIVQEAELCSTASVSSLDLLEERIISGEPDIDTAYRIISGEPDIDTAYQWSSEQPASLVASQENAVSGTKTVQVASGEQQQAGQNTEVTSSQSCPQRVPESALTWVEQVGYGRARPDLEFLEDLTWGPAPSCDVSPCSTPKAGKPPANGKVSMRRAPQGEGLPAPVDDMEQIREDNDAGAENLPGNMMSQPSRPKKPPRGSAYRKSPLRDVSNGLDVLTDGNCIAVAMGVTSAQEDSHIKRSSCPAPSSKGPRPRGCSRIVGRGGSNSMATAGGA